MPKPEQVVADGLANVAHSIRRSTATYIAMCLLPEGSSMEQLQQKTEEVAAIIRGRANSETVPKPAPLGEPFSGAGGYSED